MRKLISDNTVEVVKILLKRMKISFTEYTLSQLRDHPDYPSLASIDYTLNGLKLKTVTVRVNYEDLLQFPKPLLVHTHSNGGMFLPVDDLTQDEVHFLDENLKIVKRPKEEFTNTWSGIVMAFENEGHSRENDYYSKRFNSFVKSYGLLVSAVSLLAIFGLIYWRMSSSNWAFILPFFIINVFGFLISSLILIHKYDKQNTLVRNICVSGTDSGCDNVLDSEAANLFGLFSWAEIGITYFLSLLFLMIIQPNAESVASISLSSIITTPFIAYSLYQQGVVLKSWCRLCLLVLLTLLFNAMFAIAVFFQSSNLFASISLVNLTVLVLCTLMIGASSTFLNHVYQELVDIKEKAKYLNKIKFSQVYFELALQSSKKVDLSGISSLELGNPNAETRITIVTNPFCRPCRDLHLKLFKIVQSKQNVSVNLILLPDHNPGSIRVAELMYEILKFSEPKDSRKSIESYYSKYFRNPDLWIRREKLNASITEDVKMGLNEHINWCVRHKIHSTPVVLFNNNILPVEYSNSISDLDYILN